MIAILDAVWIGQPLWSWLLFAAVVLLLLAFDLGLLHRRPRAIGVREGLLLSAAYAAAGLAFAAVVQAAAGPAAALDYLTGFVIEKSLSLDNVFMIAAIFGVFAIPARHQHRVLFWGIVGVVLLRALLIGGGALLVERFAWVMSLFGVLLIVTGWRMWRRSAKPAAAAAEPLPAWLRARLAVVDERESGAFVVRTQGPAGRSFAITPLMLALLAIEAADLMFAIDSVPAILSITTDPFVVYTSNIFALLGMRALYFALAAMIERFDALKPALALVLVFIGGKILFAEFVAPVTSGLSLIVTLALVAGGFGWSIARPGARGRPRGERGSREPDFDAGSESPLQVIERGQTSS